MGKEPFNLILNRTQAEALVARHVQRQIDVFHSMLDVCSNVGPECLNASEKNVEDVVLLVVLYGQVLRMFDALAELAGRGCFDAAKLQLRAMFEASVAISWILKKDTNLRAKHYFVASIRKELEACLLGIPGTPQNRERLESLGDIPPPPLLQGASKDQAKAAEIRCREILHAEEYRDVNSRFETIRGKRNFDKFKWHEPLGCKSLFQMCKDVGTQVDYDHVYAWTSEAAHGSNFFDHAGVGGGSVTFQPTRDLGEFNMINTFAPRYLASATLTLLRHYNAGEAHSFSQTYEIEWQPIIAGAPRIKMKNTDAVVD